jgi:hypothetical protein
MIAKAPTPKAPGHTPQKMLLAAEVPMDFRRFFSFMILISQIDPSSKFDDSIFKRIFGLVLGTINRL